MKEGALQVIIIIIYLLFCKLMVRRRERAMERLEKSQLGQRQAKTESKKGGRRECRQHKIIMVSVEEEES